jgi:hypothetical protein
MNIFKRFYENMGDSMVVKIGFLFRILRLEYYNALWKDE